MISLLRHFKVKDTSKIWLNSNEFNQWAKDYDTFELEFKAINLPNNINKFYVSSQNRAIKTADSFNIDYEVSDLLVEVPIEAFIDTKLKFPKWFWLLIGRLLWFFNLTKSENKEETIKRVETFISTIDLNSNILIVSHGFFMMKLIKRLRFLGFEGNIPLKLKNSTIYNISKKENIK